MVRSFVLVLLGAFLVLALPATVAKASEVESGVVLRSASLWRGLTWNDGMVLQPSMDARLAHTLFIRGDLNIDFGTYGGQRERGDISRLELAFGAAPQLGPVRLELGLLELLYPGGQASTRELYADAALSLAAGFRARLAMHGDIREAQGFFFRGGLDGAWEFGPGLFADCEGMIGMATRSWASYYGGRSGGAHHLYGAARFGWRPAAMVDLFVAVEATMPLRESVLPESRAPQRSSFGAGVMTRF